MNRFWDIMKKLTKWLIGSFDVGTNGGSAKKLTAFAFMLLVGWLHFVYADKDNAIEFLIVDVSAILTLLGVSTIDKIQQLKHQSNNGNDQPQ